MSPYGKNINDAKKLSMQWQKLVRIANILNDEAKFYTNEGSAHLV